MKGFKNYNFIIMTVIFFLIVGFASGVRTYLALNVMDYDSGMYTENTVIETVLYFSLIISFIALFFLPFRNKEQTSVVFSPISAMLIKSCNVVMGLFIITGFIFSFLAEDDVLPAKNTTVFMIAENVAMLLTIIVCFQKGFSKPATTTSPPAPDLISSNASLTYIFPCLWNVCRLANTFSKYTAVANIPEHLFTILSLSGITMFLLSEGKYLAGISKISKRGRLWVWSLVGAALVFISFIPKISVFFIKPEIVNPLSISDFINAFIGVYAVIFAFCSAPGRSRNQQTLEQDVVTVTEREVEVVLEQE